MTPPTSDAVEQIVDTLATAYLDQIAAAIHAARMHGLGAIVAYWYPDLGSPEQFRATCVDIMQSIDVQPYDLQGFD